MKVLITYDIATSCRSGKRRLKQVAKVCSDHGQRVQKSVFECSLDYSRLNELRNLLASLLDQERDSVRFYFLGETANKYVEKIGVGPVYSLDEPLLF